ncbi:MAG: hypothetical protein KGL90_03185 [Burkholderiales bacterium]|nr:hypothetical protein [Burkholderiales bacterium]
MSRLKSRLVSGKRLHCGVKAAPQYLTGLDIVNGHIGVPIVLVYPNGFDMAVFEQSLLETLKKYPIIAGRVKKDPQGHQYIDSNDAGIDFRVHRCDGVLPAYGHQQPFGDGIEKYFKRIFPWQVVNKDLALFQVDVYQFDGKGIILCCHGVHTLMDGTAYWQFMLDWSKACRGLASPAPDFGRDAVINAGKNNTELDMSGQVYEPTWPKRIALFCRLGMLAPTWKKGVYRIPASMVAQWKQQAKNELPDTVGVSTVELVTAHCLKTLSPVMASPKDRSVGIVLDLRHKRRLKIPRDYFGNALGYAEAKYTRRELENESLPVLAQKCRPDSASVSTESLFNFLTLMERFRQKKAIWRLFWKAAGETADAGMVLNNCIHFPIYEIDFGRGAPSWYDLCGVAFRMLMVVQTPDMDGGVDLHLTAQRKELQAMAKSCQPMS